jgi:hypothetical protein
MVVKYFALGPANLSDSIDYTNQYGKGLSGVSIVVVFNLAKVGAPVRIRYFAPKEGLMTVLLMLLFFAFFLGLDYYRKTRRVRVMKPGTEYTTPGYEFMGALAQDGGEPAEKEKK